MPRGTPHHIHPLMRGVQEGQHVIVHMAGGGVIPGTVQPSPNTEIMVLSISNGSNEPGRAEIVVGAIGAITRMPFEPVPVPTAAPLPEPIRRS